MRVYTSINLDAKSDLHTVDNLHPIRQIEHIKKNKDKDIAIFTFSPYVLLAAETYNIQIIELETGIPVKDATPYFYYMARPFQTLENEIWETVF